jgi:hypothetical protein
VITPARRAQRIWEKFVGLGEPCRHWPGTQWIAEEIRKAERAARKRVRQPKGPRS